MKKLFFALAALLCTVSIASAQETGVNFALASNGATATASTGNPSLAIDGNNESRWDSEQKVDPQWFQVDLGQSRTFNTIQIEWEVAYAATFTLEYSVNGDDWTNFATIENNDLATANHYNQIFDVESPVTAQYVKFTGTKRGSDFGYSFYEFRVFLASQSILTTVEAKPANAICKPGETLPIEITAKDQNGKIMSGYEVTYTIEPADAGTIENNIYTPAKMGNATITAAVGDVKAAPFSVFAYEGENVALSTNINESKIIAQSEFAPSGTDAFHAIDADMGSAWQGCPTNGTAGDEESRTFDCWFVVDLGGFYDINLVSILFEGACSQEYHLDFSQNNQDWNIAYNYVGNEGINGHTDYLYGENLQNSTSVRFVRFYSTRAATNYGMKIFDMKVIATKGQAPEDTEKPVMVSAELISIGTTSAVIAVEATDNMLVAKYNVKDEANGYNASFAPQDGQITVTGLKTNTAYNLSITALDMVNNESDNAVVVELTTPAYFPEPTIAAPVPTHDAANVLSIYSDSYQPTTGTLFNQPWWTQPTMEEKDIEGNHYLRYSAPMNGINGWEFISHIDASKMVYLHVDIWASVDGTITMSPIFLPADGGAQQEVAIILEVKQEQWNSFDIKLADYPTLNAADIFQTKWSDYATQSEFSVDNFYFWAEGTSTLLDAIETTPVIIKTIENGQLIIIRDDVRYNIMGNILK